jgi:hypothetical protein
VARYGGDRRVRSLTCAEQFRAMAFAQLTYRESLRDIEACLSAQPAKLYPMGFRSPVRRSTLAEANESRDWRIYAELAQRLMLQARKLYASEDLGVDLDAAAYTLDSTTIDLCLSLFPWAHFRSTKSAVKMHTLLDLRGNIPAFIRLTTGDVHDVNILDEIVLQAGAYYVMDRGYLDYARLYRIHLAGAFFVTRAKSNLDAGRIYSEHADRQSGILADQSIALNGYDSRKDYPSHLRRIRFQDPDRQESGLSDQSVHAARHHRLCTLQKPLADRVVLQVDQAASPHQSILRNQRERRQNPTLDRGLGLPAGRHRQEKARIARLALHFVASPLRNSVRENAHFKGTSAKGLHKFANCRSQPNDSVRLLTGQQ